MKKTLLTIALASLGLPCLAAVSVNWLTPSNSIMQSDGTTPAPQSWMVQLIWSPDNAISGIDTANPFVPTDNERIFAEGDMFTTAPGVAGRITVGKVSQTDDFATGFVYTRVFNVDYNGGSPSTPTLYGNSSIITGQNGAGGVPTGNGLVVETSDPLTVSRHWATGGTMVVNQVLVPEPSTYAFFGLGAVVVARRLRKR